MGAVFAAIWKFANSPAGSVVIGSVSSWIYHHVFGAGKSNRRLEAILALAKELGAALPSGEWKALISALTDAMTKAKLGELSGTEFAAVKTAFDHGALAH